MTEKVGRNRYLRYLGLVIVGAVIVGTGMAAYYATRPLEERLKGKTVVPTIAGVMMATPTPIVITDVLGRKVTLSKVPAQRVVSQIAHMPVEVFAIAGGNAFKKIVGWDEWKQNRGWFWEKYKKKFPEIEDIPDVGTLGNDTFNAEKVISLSPQALLISKYQYQGAKDIIDKLECAGIPVVCVDYHAERVETHVKSTLLQGKILGGEGRAQELVDYYKDHVNNVYSRVKKMGKPKPKVYIESGSTCWSTYGNYMWGSLIEHCGGINIAKRKFARQGWVSPEYVLQANPDIIIITGAYWPKRPETVKLGYYADLEESRELLRKWVDRPGWDNINAVKNGRVYAIHHAISRHIWDLVAIEAFAKWFYPDEFKDLDPVRSFKEFHERFLPVDYSGVWMVGLKD